MLRTMLGAVAMVGLCVALAAADKQQADKKGDKGQKEAKIIKVDPKNHTVTVRMTNNEGKEVEKTFKLAEDIVYADSTGKVATAAIFTSGDMVLFVEAEGHITKMMKKNKGDSPQKNPNEKDKKRKNSQ